MPLLQSSSSSPSRSSSPTPVKLEALIILPNGSPVGFQSENSASNKIKGDRVTGTEMKTLILWCF